MTLMPQVVKYSLISIQSFSPCRFWISFKYRLRPYPRHFKFYQSLRLSIFWSKMTTTKKQLVNFDQFIKYHFILKYNTNNLGLKHLLIIYPRISKIFAKSRHFSKLKQTFLYFDNSYRFTEIRISILYRG